MWIILNYKFTQLWQACLQRVPVLLLLNHSQCFPANDIRGWQVRFAQSKTNIARLRSIRDLTNRAPFDSAQECRWLKLFPRLHRLMWRVLVTFQWSVFSLCSLVD